MSSQKQRSRDMVDEGEAAPRRVAGSDFPHPRVRLTHLSDGELAFDVLCASCNRYHLAVASVSAAGTCHGGDFRPAGAAAFTPTHAHNLSASDDYPDATATATNRKSTRLNSSHLGT